MGHTASAVYLVFALCFIAVPAEAEVGRFWHVSDYHYDHTYWTGGLSCNAEVSNPGKYGDYWCDSPWRLVQDSIDNMARIQSDVDFVIWTGDTVAHIKDEFLSLEINIEILQNITDALTASLPNVPVYASLGNHDFFPSDQAQPGEDEIYRQVSAMWADWIDNQTEVDLFKEGGYYAARIQPKIKLLALNTNLYYTSNKVTGTTEDDPAGQMAWMTNHLEEARTKGEKVIVTGHVPPGVKTPGFVDWYYPVYKPRFVEVLTKYSDVIAASHFGHDHSDGFKILENSDGTKAVQQFTAPSITPWRYKFGDETGAAHNPGMRLLEYDRDTGKHLNYHQYYINLTDTNRNDKADWAKLYSFKDAYKVDDLSVASLREIFSRMEKEEGKEYSSKYCQYTLVSSHEQPCSDQMRAEIYCGGLHHDLTEATKCRDEYIKDRNAAATHTLPIVLTGATVVLGYIVRLMN